MKAKLFLPVMVALTFFSHPAFAATTYRIHYKFVDSPSEVAPKKVVILPVDIHVNEISAGGLTEEVKEWSKAASSNIRDSLKKQLKQLNKFEAMELPELDPTQNKAVEQHIALYDQVAGSAYLHTSSVQIWKHKIAHFDYTLGNGLDFLRQQTGADAAIFVIGNDYVSSSGRAAMTLFAAAMGVGIASGRSFLTIGIVDLKTGDLLWFDHTLSQALNMREPADAATLVERILKNYPGIERYKKEVERYKPEKGADDGKTS